METMISIGARLREEREAVGLTQGEFAKFLAEAGIAGATRQSQGNYENGKQQPGAEYLAAIHKLGVDVSYVLSGKRFIESAADWVVRVEGTEEYRQAVLGAISRFEQKLRDAGCEIGDPEPIGSVKGSIQTSNNVARESLIPQNVYTLDVPQVRSVQRDDVCAMVIDVLHERKKTLPSEKVWAIVDSIMTLQRGGITVNKSTVDALAQAS